MDPCACLAARRSARAVTQLYDLVLSPTGLKATQFITLRAVSAAGEITQRELSSRYQVSVESVCRRVNSALDAGYLEVCSEGRKSDRRYRLTEKGRAALAAATPHWKRAERRLFQQIGPDRWAAFLEVAEKIATAARDAEFARATNA